MIKRFRDWQVRNKLIFSFGIIVLMLLSVSIYFYIVTEKMISKAREVEIREFQGLGLSTEMRICVLKMGEMFSRGNFTEIEHDLEEATIQREKFLILADEYKSLFAAEEESLSLADNISTSVEEYYDLGKIIASMKMTATSEAEKEVINDVLESFHLESENIQEMFYEFQDRDTINLSMGLAQIETQSRKLQKVFLVLFIAVLVFGIILGASLSSLIERPLLDLKEAMLKISKGSFGFNVPVKTKDEFGDVLNGFNEMSNKLRDITISKEVLEKEVKTRMIAEHKLQEYTKEVENINKELDSFTYIISHDLKEPLRSIDAFSGFVLEDYKDKLDEEGVNNLNRVRKNAKKMKQLIEDLLEISRIERKRNPFTDVPVKDIIDDVKQRLEFAIEEKNIEIKTEQELPVIFCDKIRMTEVFANLVSNAIKFMDKEKPLIEIGCSEDGNYYKLYVKDNGIGIKEEYKEKVFEIFQRLNKKEHYEGTGAGLTIVKKIIQMHHGKIWIESEFGKGSTFYFTILKDKEAVLAKRKIGEILVDSKVVTNDQIQKALEEQST